MKKGIQWYILVIRAEVKEPTAEVKPSDEGMEIGLGWIS